MPRLAIVFFLIICCLGNPCWAEDTLVVGDFSAPPGDGGLPAGWEPLIFDGIDLHTLYSVVQDDGKQVVRAESRGSSSGLVRKISIDPAEYPLLSFLWKIQDVIGAADLTQKGGDDAPARVYITFAYDGSQVGFWEAVKFKTIKLFYGEYPPIGALMYVWASHVPQNSVLESPYTDRVRIIVLESGAAQKGQWLVEKRNLVQDYQQAFGSETVPLISGVAIMTDTDNTGGQAVAWYGDLVFSR